MTNKKRTSRKIGRFAAIALAHSQDKTERRLAGSALSQRQRDAATSTRISRLAGAVLRKRRSSLAGSVLSQTEQRRYSALKNWLKNRR